MRDNEPRIYGPYPHGEQWRVHYVSRGADGKRTTKYTTHETRTSADLEIAGARDETQGVTVKAAVEMYVAKQRTRGNAESTLALYMHRLNAILGLPANSERPIRWLSNRGVELYDSSKLKRNGATRKADTHLGGLAVGKRFGAFCVKQKLLRANPFEDVEGDGKLRRGASKDKLRVDESRVLQRACHEHGGLDAALVLSYLLLGPRCSEVTNRSVRDLDDDGRLLWLDRTKTEAGERRLIVPDELRALLLEQCVDRGPDEKIFLNLSGKPMSRRVAYQRVVAFTKRVLGRAIGPQGLRRTQSTLATDAGATGPMVSAHLGHVVKSEMSAVTKRSYVDPNAVRDAKAERSFRVLAGGKS